MLRLREAAGPVRLVNARSRDPAVAEMTAAGFDLDKGMAAKIGGVLYHGDECMNALSLLTTPSGLFNRTVRMAFGKPRLAKLLYPPLVAGRNLTLLLLRRRRQGK